MRACTNKGNVLEIREINKTYPINPTGDPNSRGERWEILKKTLFGNKNKKEITEDFFALKDVSLEIKKSESLGIIGLNGSGKSTLVQIIAGTLQPTSGDVAVNGKVAALLELGSGFNPDFTGKENVFINGKILGMGKDEIKSKLGSIEEFAEIGDFFHQPVSTYSSGMVLRLAFAVLVQVNPEVLIVDEALAVGDARFQLKCFSFLEEFKSKGGSLILVSHDLNSVARLCSQSVLLHNGSKLAEGKPNDVINEYTRILSLDEKSNKTNADNRNSLKRDQILAVETTKSKEFSYGGTKAVINDIKLLNHENDETLVLKSGEEFYVSFLVEAKERITSPIYALTMKDSRGQQVYGQNTHFSKAQVESLSAGDRVQIKFQQYANLGAGDYFISLGLTRFEGDNLEIIHRRYDALKVKVINTDGSFGITNCYSSITCIKCKEFIS